MPNESQTDVHQYLDSPDGLKLISKIAVKIYKKASYQNIKLDFINIDLGTESNLQSVLTALESEIYIFVTDKYELIRDKLAKEPDSNIEHWIEQKFWGFCRDKNRLFTINPRKALYHSIARILREAHTFHTQVIANSYTAYSLHSETHPIPPIDHDEIKSIPFPLDITGSLDFTVINHHTVWKDLAKYFFLKIASSYQSEQIHINVRDFVYWLTCHIVIDDRNILNENGKKGFPKKIEHTIGHRGKSQDAADKFEFIGDEQFRPDKQYFDKNLVEFWAQAISAQLTDREKIIFILKCDTDKKLTLKQIAKQVGQKHPSHISYQWEQIKIKMRYFLRDLPWLSPDDNNEINPDAIKLFTTCLVNHLKKSVSIPYGTISDNQG